ncbi:MAG: glycogen/starch synthase [Paludibacteraceae bacterium]|nr:glycogen/starch synthase [Paludibacteraceae bacterium]
MIFLLSLQSNCFFIIMAVKVLYITQEIFPYLPESEIANKSRQLPQAIQELGREIRTFMPKYGCVNERRNQLHEVIRLSGMNLIIDDTDHQLIIKVASIPSARIQVYFIDNEEFFKRRFVVKDEAGNDFADNDERAIFFARGVLETVKKLRWTPDIIHCHGWMSAVVPVMVKKAYHDDPFFEKSKVVYSVYNDEFTTPMPDRMAEKILMNGIESSDLTAISQKANYETLSKLAMEYSDGVIQASENINANVLEDIKKSQKLFLPYVSEENYVTSYNEFYDKVLEK